MADTSPLLGPNCSSCGAAILWTKTERGRNMPVDAATDPAGTIRTQWRNGLLRSIVVEAGSEPELHKSHFATCPNAGKHRRVR
ncbi:MAG: hypothetical protein ACYCWW_00180 [Deltaproteobacteria bacterium]